MNVWGLRSAHGESMLFASQRGGNVMSRRATPRLTASIQKSLGFVFLIALAAPIASPLLFGQALNTGTFLGTVHDPSGAAIPRAVVRIMRENPAFTREVRTDEAGNYLAPQVPIGEYRIEF